MRKIILLFVLMLSLGLEGYSETIVQGREAHKLVHGAELIRYVKRSTVPAYVRFRAGAEPDQKTFGPVLRKLLNMSEADALVLRDQQADQLGFTHYRFAQEYDGIPVEAGSIILHSKAGKIQSLNGEFYAGLQVATAPTVSLAQARQAAIDHVGATTFMWEDPAEEERLRFETGQVTASYFPVGQLAIAPQGGELSAESMRLVWKFDIYAQAPLSRAYVYVDALTGQVIWEQNRIKHADVVGTANTRYSGTRSFTTDSFGGSYRLREAGRGNGIETYDLNNATNYGGAVDFTDNDNIWNNINANQDEVATDAHWGSEMTYDYFLNDHGRNSIDGNGFKLLSYVHYGNNFNNAFWDGQRMTYGDGDGNLFTPLTALDVTGHEITHGLTDLTANLIYQNESGALNESFSDIFGNCIEHYARPNDWSWIVGEDMTPSGNGIRNMETPNQFNDPDTYQGTFYYTGPNDNGGVHTNSGVQNKWFYIMTEGEIGTNDNGDAYNVTAQGFNKASAIAFRNLTVYLTAGSNHADARFYAIQSATDLYGACTPEVIATTDAWYAVGVGSAFSFTINADFTANPVASCTAPADVTFNNLSVNGGTYLWDFGDGNTSTQNSPTHTYANLGTYTVTLIAYGGSCGNDTLVRTSYISVDTNNACTVTLNPTGTTQTQTACAGTVYDTGGALSDYGPNTDAVVTIAPTGAATVTLTFTAFAFESNYDYLYVYDGPNINSPLIGQYDGFALPNGGSITSTGGSITLRQTTDQLVEEAGFEASWNCTMPAAPPNTDFEANTLTSCDGVIDFTDMSTNGPLTWDWNFGDGNTSNQQNPQHSYQANGTYTVTLITTNAIGGDTLVRTAYVTVARPAGPSTTGASRCGPGVLNLSANGGGGSLSWYDAPVGGNLVGSGPSFTTPFLNSTTTYYVEEEVPSPTQFVPPATPAAVGTGGYHNNNSTQYLEFTVNTDLTLVSAYVDPGASGNRTITLWDGTGAFIRDTTMNISSQPQRITLNWTLSPGNYRIGGSNMDLYRNNAGPNYPYTAPGLVSITGSSAGASFYYYLYDWEVRPADCISERTAVTATVEAVPVAGTTPAGTVSICPGSSVTLNGTGGGNYTWSTGATTQSISVNQAGTYHVVVTNGAGCSDTSATVTVQIQQPQAAINPSGPTTFCNGDSVTLVAAPGSNYSWSTGATTQSITVLATGSYTVTMTDQNGCTGTATETVTVTNTPTVNITANGNTTLCQGDNVTLTATQGNTYVWSTGATTQSINIAQAGTYNVTVTFPGGCSGIGSAVTVTVNPAPTAGINGTTTICQGETTTLTATGGASYVWSNGDQTAATTVGAAGTYTVTVTDGNGCTDTATETVVVNAAPNAQISGVTAICQGESTTLTASGGTGYLWSNGDQTAATNVMAAGTYTVTVTGQNGCTATVSETVVVNALPNAQISGSATICDGESTVLTASGGTGYVWSNGDQTAGTTVTTSGTYTVTVTDGNGCEATASETVVVNPTPTADYSFTTAQMQADFTDMSNGATSWNWDFGDGNTSTQQNPSHTYTTAGTYNVILIVTNSFGCSDTTSYSVTVTDVAIEDPSAGFEVQGIYPNPFSDALNFKLELPHAGRLRITAVDMLGRRLNAVYDAEVGSGSFTHTWNPGIDLAEGTYLIQIEFEGATQVHRLIHLR